MTILIVKNDITKFKGDIIVNAANAIGVMGAGVAGAISRAGGPDIMDECMTYCKFYNPQAGHAYLTKAGNLPCYKVMHAVTMRLPGTSYRKNEKEGLENVRKCINNILLRFKESEFQSIAVPALATGIGGLDTFDVAKIIVQNCYKHKMDKSEKLVVLCDIDGGYIQDCHHWNNYYKGENE